MQDVAVQSGVKERSCVKIRTHRGVCGEKKDSVTFCLSIDNILVCSPRSFKRLLLNCELFVDL